MANITYRESTTPTVPGTTTAKLTPLTNLEVDGNFKSLNDDIALKAPINNPTFTGNATGLGVATGTSFNAITGLSATTPVIDGTATVGVGTTAARGDHVHPTDTSRLSATAIVAGQYGGTGVANTSKTITVGGNFTTSGAFTTTLTATGNTTVTLPTTGTLATLAGSETFTNKTLTSAILNGGYTEQVYTLTGTTPVIDEVNGSIQTWSLTANSTPTESLATGQSVILVITPGAFTITWPTTVWTKVGGSGAAPTLFTAGKTMVVLYKVGSTLYGSHLGDA